MLFVSLLALSPSPPASVPPRFQHTSYQGWSAKALKRPAGLCSCARRGRIDSPASRRSLRRLGRRPGCGSRPMRQRLIELDLDERSTLQGLLRLAERLERRG